jgi:hypothetical protein
MKIHMELEEKIARFKNVEACVVFQSGFTANAGTVSAILGKEDFIVTDALNHASIIDGCRLSRAKILVFRHKDVAHAEEQLESVKNEPGKKLLITDGVFSMDGDIGPLPALCNVAEKYGAVMMVDDARMGGWTFRWARFQRPLGHWAGMFAGRGILLIFFITGRGRFCFPRPIRRRWQLLALQRLMFWSRNRSAWSGFGRIRGTGRRSWVYWDLTSAG